MDPRERRLIADARKVRELAANSDLIEATAIDGAFGRPPEIWEITYRCRGVVGASRDGAPIYGTHHRVRIELGREYPDQPPVMRWLTPILHPNIEGREPHRVCIDQAHWQVGQTLDRIVLMIGEMVQYKNYHAEDTSPWPLDTEAAAWARRAERAGHFSKSKPVDPRPLLRPDVSAAGPGLPGTTRPSRVTFKSTTSAPARTRGSRIRITGEPS
jgi:ubiquitin-protein ligase